MAKGGGGIGGLLGSLLGGVGAALFPEIGIPALALEAGGSFLGSAAGGLASGEPIGKALLGGAEAGALTGVTAGVGDLIAGVPLGSTEGPLSGLFGGSVGGGGAGAASAVDTAALTAGGDAGIGAAGQLAAASPMAASPGGFSIGGGDISNIAASTGASIPPIPTSLGVSSPGGEGFTGGLNAADLGGQNFVGSITDAGSTGGGNGSVFPTSSGGGPGGAVNELGQPDFSSGASGGGDLGSKILGYITNNPGLLLGTGLLGSELLMNRGVPQDLINPLKTGASGLNTTAAGLIGGGQQDLASLQTGQVPPGAQSLLDQTTASAKASVRSNFANLGLSGSTMEADKLAQVDQNVAAQKWQIIQGLVQSGLGEVGAGVNAANSANSIYTKIMEAELGDDKATQDALSRFAAAIAGGGVAAGRQAA